MPIDKYENDMQHSLYGRKFGIDFKGRTVGAVGPRVPTEFSTAGSTLDNDGGMSVLSGSTGFWTLAAPLVKGVEKTILNASTLSTALMVVARSTALGACGFLGSTTSAAGGIGSTNPGVRLNLQNAGACVRLVSVSSDIWAPVGGIGFLTSTTILYNISTST